MRETIKRLLVVLLIAGSCIGCDRMSKETAREHLRGLDAVYLLGGLIRVEYTENSGGMFSLGADMPAGTRGLLFVAFVGFMLTVILFVVAFHPRVDMRLAVAGALVIGGGLGNVIDRLMYGGVVIDFLNLGIGFLRTAVFNVADVAIVTGIFLFIFMRVRATRPSDLSANQGPKPKL